jgi:hypothetical protein
MAKENMAKEK